MLCGRELPSLLVIDPIDLLCTGQLWMCLIASKKVVHTLLDTS